MSCDVCKQQTASGWTWIRGIERAICPQCYRDYLDARDKAVAS